MAIIVLGYFVWESIQQPIRFNKVYNNRKAAVIERLCYVRDAQVAYKSVYHKYTGSFDTLVAFIKSGTLPLVKMEGSLTDSMIAAGMTEVEALKKGIIKRDTTKVSVMDSLARNKYNVDSLRYVPFSNKQQFEMGATSLATASGVRVQVFEAKTDYDVFLSDLDKQEVINLKDEAYKLEKYPGLKVGSLQEANNNAGNWE
jgi:hypothetical protein